MSSLINFTNALFSSGRVLCRFAIASVMLSAAGVALAQDNYPSRSITLVVPYTAGTGVDVLSRIVGKNLSERFGQPIVVDNRVGASGNIGVRKVAGAAPDGYTLLAVVNTFTINPAVSSAGYDPIADFSHIGMMAKSGMALVANSTVDAGSLSELVALIKKNPGKYFYASTGIGSPQHLSMELLKRAFALDVLHVPHRSAGEANTSLLAGQTNMMFMPINIALQPLKQGKIRALAVSTGGRDPALPSIRTVAEQGASGFDVALWYALLAPAGTSPAAVQKLAATLKDILQLPEVVQTMTTLGMVADYMTPAELRDHVQKEAARWSAVARAANIKGE